MKIKTELLKACIADEVVRKLDDMQIDATGVVDTKAIMMLGEIYALVQKKDWEPNEIVEAIEQVFHENNIRGLWWSA